MQEKQYEIEQTIKKIKKIHGNDLPIYRRYDGYKTKWMYRLKVIEGYLTAHKIIINDNGKHEFQNSLPDLMFDDIYKPSTKEEWDEATCELLTIINHE
jgi:hypothetical protein